jgi:hypothetical protein
MIDSFFAGYGVGSGGVGGLGPEVGPKTAVAVTVIAAGLGVLYLALRKPDPQPDTVPSRTSRTDQVRGWGDYR